MAILGYAGAAGSYAFNTASSYYFRSDASTSRGSSQPTQTGSTVSSARRNSRRGSQFSSNAKYDYSSEFFSAAELDPDSSLPPLPEDIEFKRDRRANSSEQSEGERLCAAINREENLYRILGTDKKAKAEEIRRAFLGRSRLCHPDKLPLYAAATPAFQRLSYAYETLSKPASRRIYDLGGGRGYDPAMARDAPTTASMGDETLNGVLRNVFTEFLAGDFETIRVFVNALNEGNPGLNLGDEAVDNLEGAFKRVRELLLAGQKYLRLIKFELIRLYEIQHSLRSLGYLDLVGRLRLTLALTRVTLEIPLVLDRAMREDPVGMAPTEPFPKRPGYDSGSDTSGLSEGVSRDAETDGSTKRSKRPRKNGYDRDTSHDTSSGSPAESSGLPAGDNVSAGELQRRGLLGPRVKGVLVVACKVLEKGERFGVY